MRHPLLSIALLLAVVAGAASPCHAGSPHVRDGWYLGLGFGPARGAFEDVDSDGSAIWETGSSPQIRFGRMLGQRFAFGLEAQTWFTEVGTVGDIVPLQVKVRLTGHLWALAGTWFPGDPASAWGGFYVRAGAGPAISNYSLAIPDPGDETGARELQVRIDEWGWGMVGTAGYEWRVSRNFAAGIQFSLNYLRIDDIITRVYYGGPAVNLNWYF